MTEDEQGALSPQTYHALLECSSDLVAIVGRDGKTTYTSPSYGTVLGYTAGDLAGTSPLDRIHPDDRPTARVALTQAMTGPGEQVSIQVRYRHADGSWRILHVTATNRFDDPAVGALIVSSRDITERVLAERALLEREAQYRGIFESTGDAVIIGNLDRLVVEVNPAACRMYGYTREEFLGLDIARLFHPDYLHLMVGTRQASAQGRDIEAEAINFHADGSQFYVEAHGTSFLYRGQPHILLVARDVTERVQARDLLENRVEERTRELTTLLEVSRNVASTLELAPLLKVILDQLGAVVEYGIASIVIREGDETIVLDSVSSSAAGGPVLQRRPTPPGVGLLDAVLRGEPLIIDDIRADSPVAAEFRRAMGPLIDTVFAEVSSWMGVRLALKNRSIGMLTLGHSERGRYTARDAELTAGIASQAALAVENARLYEQARDLAALEERQRLARELHDSVSQALYGIVLGARTARALLERDPARALEPLDYVLGQADAGLTEMRALIFELRPEMLEAEGLVAVLGKQVAAVRARHHLAVEATLGEEPEVPFAVKEGVYRIAQEALHNIVKHARANRAELRFDSTPEGLTLEIRDDGKGFDPQGDFPGHIGLKTMRERAERLGGTLEVESTPGEGTLLLVRVPQTRSAEVTPA